MQPKHNLREHSTIKPQGEDAAFLVEEFELPVAEAAELVKRDGAEGSDVVDAARREVAKGDDTLEGAPVPREPANDLTADVDEERLKPVVRRNERSGAG